METPRWRKIIGIIFIAASLVAVIAVIRIGVQTRDANQASVDAETPARGDLDSSASGGSGSGANGTYALGVLPEPVMQAPPEVREAYSFATDPDNHELMQTLTCYCGCEAGDGLNHDSLFTCYVEKLLPDDQIIYSSHAFGCQLCLAEALDASKWNAQGRSAQEIKEQIDVKFGSSR